MVSAAGALDSVGGKGQETMDMDRSKPTKKIPRNKFVIACAVLASTNSILFGYDVGVMSGAVIFIKKDLKISDVQEEVLIGSLNIISLLGSGLAGRTSDAIGRRWTMALAAFIFLVGALVMAVSPSFAWLMVGRSVAGIGVGYALLIAPVYTAEVAPAASRGSLTCFPEIFINVGILIGYIANYALQGLPPHLNWRVMIGLGAVPPLFLGIAVLMMPESPRWLLMRGRNEDAMKVLLRTSVDQAEASERLEQIVEGIQYAKQNALVHESSNPKKTSNPNKTSKNDGEGKWRELYKPSKAIRRMLIIALGIQFFQQAGGIDATVYYSPVTFRTAGINSQGGILGATMAVGFAKAGFVVVAAVLIDKVGRRPLLLTSAIGSTVSLLALATALAVIGKSSTVGMGREVASYLAVIAACGNVAFFSVGMGPVNWVLGAEIFPLRLRAKAASLGVAVNRGMSGVISMTFLSISKAMTVPGTFYLFAAVSALCSIFIYFCVPETKGKTLEEIVESFHVKPQESLDKMATDPSELELGNRRGIPVEAETAVP